MELLSKDNAGAEKKVSDTEANHLTFLFFTFFFVQIKLTQKGIRYWRPITPPVCFLLFNFCWDKTYTA